MNATKINIHKFSELFAEIYDYLYNTRSAYDAQMERAAAEKFDNAMKTSANFRAFVSEYVDFRKDFISSDREAAAFVLALDTLANA